MQKNEGHEVRFTEKEEALVKQIADREGMTVDEAATALAKRYIAAAVRKRTGKGPAKVYSMPRKA